MVYPCPSCGRQNRIPASRLDARAHCGACKAVIVPLDHPLVIEDVASFEELVKSSPMPVVVDFWAPWCGPCLAMGPELKKLAAEQAGRVAIAKVDTDALPELSNRFGIRAVPTLIRFDRGAQTKKTSGAQSAAALADALGLPRYAA
jgi:thioredoxin 2